MITGTSLKSILVNNLNDIRMTSIALFLEELIVRKEPIEEQYRYRVLNKLTGNYITSLDDFKNAIDPDSLKMGYFYNSDVMTGDRVHPIIVGLNNFQITLKDFIPEDNKYFETFGRITRINFLLNYLSDGDAELPLKIFEVRLG